MAYPAQINTRPKTNFSTLLPYHTTLKDGRRVVLNHVEQFGSQEPSLIESMRRTLNHEIVTMGDSYPFESEMDTAQFHSYYCAYEAFCLCLVEPEQDDGKNRVSSTTQAVEVPNPSFVGCFYIKPNFPGRCSHVCNAGFLVLPQYQGCGAGYIMGEYFLHLAKHLQYRGAMFNLVFVSNGPSNRLWEKLGFSKIGTIPGVGRLRDRQGGDEVFVSANQWFYDLTEMIPHRYPPWSGHTQETLRQEK